MENLSSKNNNYVIESYHLSWWAYFKMLLFTGVIAFFMVGIALLGTHRPAVSTLKSTAQATASQGATSMSSILFILFFLAIGFKLVFLRKLPWKTFFKNLLIIAIVTLIVVSIPIIISQGNISLTPILIGIMCLLFIAYKILYYRSIALYADNTGVWLYRGIFPWSRGVIGVKWRDLDEALMYMNFTSWLTRAYTVSVHHRFSKSTEIYIKDIAKGNEFVSTLNYIHANNIGQRGY